MIFAKRCRLAVKCGTAVLVAGIFLASRSPSGLAEEGFFSALFGLNRQPKDSASDAAATHDFKKAVDVRAAGGGSSVQTFCLDREGQILALLGGESSGWGGEKTAVSEVRVLSPDGE